MVHPLMCFEAFNLRICFVRASKIVFIVYRFGEFKNGEKKMQFQYVSGNTLLWQFEMTEAI